METLECVHTRRSIRKFTDQQVSDDLLRQILEAAMSAPSAGNAQPWQFIVIRDKDSLEACTKINPYCKMAPKASVSILVCGDLSLEKYQGYWVQDCSAAIQNILLSAHDLGLGAVWTGIYPLEDRVAGFSKLFNLPEKVIPLGLIPIGHPDQPSNRVDRFKEERIHHETW